MSVDFSAGDPGKVPGNDPTKFVPDGGQGNGGAGAEDQTVVLEIGDRKFTKADLIKKITNADSHIETLTTELAQQREAISQMSETLKTSLSAADVLKKIQEAGAGGSGGDEAARAAAAAAEAAAHQPSVKPEDVVNQVLQQLQQGEQAKKEEANWNSVTTTLTSAYGDADTVNAKVKEVAEENEYTLEELADMARKKPKAFLKLFDLNKRAGTQIGRGNVNAAAYQQQQRPAQTAGYAKIRNTKERVGAYRQILGQRLANQ